MYYMIFLNEKKLCNTLQKEKSIVHCFYTELFILLNFLSCIQLIYIKSIKTYFRFCYKWNRTPEIDKVNCV